MNTERQSTQDSNSQQQPAQKKEGNESVQISQPHNERAEGPFPHSGETSGWTKEEKEEKEQDQDSQQH